MASIADRLLNLTPRGLPAIAQGKATAENITTPLGGNDISMRAAFAGLPIGNPSTGDIRPPSPHHSSVGGGSFPPVTLHPQFLPPNRRFGLPSRLPVGHLGANALLDPSTRVRKGIVHPGRRLGRTGNPAAGGVPGQGRGLR